MNGTQKIEKKNLQQNTEHPKQLMINNNRKSQEFNR